MIGKARVVLVLVLTVAMGCSQGNGVGATCYGAQDCAPGLTCSVEACPPGFKCTYSGNPQCYRAGGQRVGESCNTQDSAFRCAGGTDCGADAVCHGGSACTGDQDCPSGFACDAVDPAGQTYCSLDCGTDDVDWHCRPGYRCNVDGSACDQRVGLHCYVDDTEPRLCGYEGACSADTRTCVIRPGCGSPGCGSYACASEDELCTVSCGDDSDCALGARCDTASHACVSEQGKACDPASDDASQCAQGLACAPGSSTCVQAASCATNADCGDYACWSGFCLLTCTENVLFCAVGKACDLVTHECV